jgi:hypothetical protein
LRENVHAEVVGDDCWHVEVLKNLAKDALTGMDKLAKVPEAVQAQILSRIPLGRFGKPKEIAHDADRWEKPRGSDNAIRWWHSGGKETAALSINMPLRYCHVRLNLYFNNLILLTLYRYLSA